jgi:hypothetical protein
LQTAAKAGIGAALLHAIFEDIRARAPAALVTVVAALPKGFPESVVASIIGGFQSRLSRLEVPTGGGPSQEAEAEAMSEPADRIVFSRRNRS